MLSAELEEKTFLCQSHHALGTAKARLNASYCVRRMLSRTKQKWAQVIAHCAVPRLGESPLPGSWNERHAAVPAAFPGLIPGITRPFLPPSPPLSWLADPVLAPAARLLRGRAEPRLCSAVCHGARGLPRL